MLSILIASALLATQAPYTADFWQRWGDGQAELAGYQLRFPRYGAERSGSAVTIFVTETMARTERVKSDPGRRSPENEFPVLKLNWIQDFSTGIYDYNLMSSAFIALTPQFSRPAGAPTKLSFSAQEWCGHVYAQALLDKGTLRWTSHSYFDGEADESRNLEAPAELVSEDALLIWARGLAAPWVASGATQRVPLLPSLERLRLAHQPLQLGSVELSRAATLEELEVPAGKFAVEWASARVKDGPTWRFAIETAQPRRVIAWEASDGRKAELLGSERMRYWELNTPAGAAALARLGLKSRPPRTP